MPHNGLVKRYGLQGQGHSTFRVFDNGEKVSTVWTALDGRMYLTVCTPFKDIEKGDLVMEMALDITDLEKAKKEAILAREVAEKSNKAKDDFLTQMSHEFRTPLNAIMGSCQILQMNEYPRAEQMVWIDEIYKAGTHLLGLIVNILNYSSIDDGTAQMNMTFLKVNNLIGEAIELFQMLADEKGITISTNICSQDWYVIADPVWLERTLSNLISNAIKFNHKGGSVSISLSAVEEQVQIVVADTGNGIPAEHRDKVFEPFFRLERDVNLIHGVGIGLSMAKKLLRKWVGRSFWIVSLGKVPGSACHFLHEFQGRYSGPEFFGQCIKMEACCKKEQVMSESKCMNFSGKFKAKVAIEGMHSIKTVNVLARNLGCIPLKLVCGRRNCRSRQGVYSMPSEEQNQVSSRR